MSNIERRFFPGSCELRAGASGSIVGYAAKFNSRSVDLGGFVEVLAPGAFDRVLRERQDVRALIDHNPSLILGRTKAGTLRLEADRVGLRATIDPPATQAGRDIVVSVGRGDVTGMSFAFGIEGGGDRWERTATGPVRTILEFSSLSDVSVVTYPAYPETEVSARALEQARSLGGRYVRYELNGEDRLRELRHEMTRIEIEMDEVRRNA
jgi:HK97 family phage prohead protease